MADIEILKQHFATASTHHCRRKRLQTCSCFDASQLSALIPYSGAEEDTVNLKASIAAVTAEYTVSSGSICEDYVGEIVRYGASELHLVAAIMGGMAAQEAIKLITAQFVPLKGTLVYNGMTGTSFVLPL